MSCSRSKLHLTLCVSHLGGSAKSPSIQGFHKFTLRVSCYRTPLSHNSHLIPTSQGVQQLACSLDNDCPTCSPAKDAQATDASPSAIPVAAMNSLNTKPPPPHLKRTKITKSKKPQGLDIKTSGSPLPTQKGREQEHPKLHSSTEEILVLPVGLWPVSSGGGNILHSSCCQEHHLHLITPRWIPLENKGLQP